MIKLMAFDIDGTLVGKRHKVSLENKQALDRARAAGIKIALATGRSISGIKRIANQVGMLQSKEYIVGINGGLVFRFLNENESEIVSEKTFTPEETKKIFELAKKYKMKVVCYAKDARYVLTNVKRGFFIWWMKRRLAGTAEQYNPEKHKDALVYKFIAFGKSKRAVVFRDELKKLKFETFAFSYVTNSHQNIEVNPHGVDKSYGLKQLAKIYDITPKEMMFFGDGENDIAALDYVEHGVAMDNAKEHVKSHAAYITDHHLNHGVAKKINAYLDDIEKEKPRN